MSLFTQVLRLIFEEECIEEYFDHFNFLHASISFLGNLWEVLIALVEFGIHYFGAHVPCICSDGTDFIHVPVECFKATLSKVLGLGIITGSFLVKVPQIMKILTNKSSEGINVISVLLDLFAITVMVSYSFVSGFPFSAWGDGVFLGLQTLAIAVLVFHYNGDTAKATTFLAGYVVIVIATLSSLVPLNVLWSCQTLNIPIVLISKLAQAHTNYKNGSTGQLSAVTVSMLFFGSLARIFTSIQETGDMTMIVMYVCSTSANAVIVAQLLYYWNVVAKEAKSVEKTKKKQ